MSGAAGRAFERVLIIMFENQYRSYVLENPFMRRLAARGIHLANYFGVMHPSQTNYIASIAGELCNVFSDDRPDPLPQRTVVDLVEESPFDLNWAAYMDSYVPQNALWFPDLVPQDQYPYVIKHDPFSSFSRILRNETRWRRIGDESRFWRDLVAGRLPEYAWLTPNMWNDGHYILDTHEEPEDRTELIPQLASWLESFFADLRFPGPGSLLPPGTLVVVTFDESDFQAQYTAALKYTYDGPNQIYTVLLGDMIEPGVEEEGYNHYSLLRTIEKNFGLDDLGKNDAHASWFRFLWGHRFAWDGPEPTPVVCGPVVAASGLGDTLHVVHGDGSGGLLHSAWAGGTWSAPREVDSSTAGATAAALGTLGGELVLAYAGADGLLASLRYREGEGWTALETPSVAGVRRMAVTPFADGDDRALMLAWADRDGRLHSLVYRSGGWAEAPVDTGHQGPEALALSAIGPSLLLIHKAAGDQMDAISYNAADYNVIDVPPDGGGEWVGPYDSTTRGLWSPSGFRVAHFSAGHSRRTPGVDQPVEDAYRAGDRLAAAELEGVIHMVHPGAGEPLLLETRFSVAGVMTAKLPVSYKASDEKTTSNGYGTLAEAGWERQVPVPGAYLAPTGALALCRVGRRLVLLHQPDGAARLEMRVGGYTGA